MTALALRVEPGRRYLDLPAVDRAVVEALAYSDVFDWPLTAAEIHRYLPVAAAPPEVERALVRNAASAAFVERRAGLVMLRGRTDLVETRRARAAMSARLWPHAAAWARIVGRLPFVRMVAVTGSLAAGSALERDDVDLLIVTEDRRVWLTRAMTMAVVRVASLRGLRLCPNYLLARSALRLSERTLFTARELAQLVPVVGPDVYDELIARNAWYREFLPNAEPRRPVRRARTGGLRRLVEAVLRSSRFDRLEHWEMRRKARQLRAASKSSETRYDAARCKGHADAHGHRVLAAFDARLADLAREET